MRYGIYAIFDKKAKVFSQPFVAANDDVAVRVLRHLVNDQDNQVAKSPEDFTLHRLTYFDDTNGLFEPAKDTEVLINAAQLPAHQVVQQVRQLKGGNNA